MPVPASRGAGDDSAPRYACDLRRAVRRGKEYGENTPARSRFGARSRAANGSHGPCRPPPRGAENDATECGQPARLPLARIRSRPAMQPQRALPAPESTVTTPVPAVLLADARADERSLFPAARETQFQRVFAIRCFLHAPLRKTGKPAHSLAMCGIAGQF